MTGRAEEASWVIVELLKILDKAVIWIPGRSLKRLSSESPWQTCKSYTLTLNLAEAQSSKTTKSCPGVPWGQGLGVPGCEAPDTKLDPDLQLTPLKCPEKVNPKSCSLIRSCHPRRPPKRSCGTKIAGAACMAT